MLGFSGVTAGILKLLPGNCLKILRTIYNSILASKYMGKENGVIKMVFIPKPGKDPSEALNYRPLCLLEAIFKILDKVVAQRML